jgi:trans-aconitate 2-methyltransferase
MAAIETEMDQSAWNPAQYLKFGDERLRPGFELLARVGDLPPGGIFELGCGTGEHARAIAARWPDRTVVALDHSPEMLAKAAATPAPQNLSWREGDIAPWSARERAALIFSNATLHWLPDHGSLFPRLAKQLAPGGVLAVQMPANFHEPSHSCIRDLALNYPFSAKLAVLTEPGGPLRDDLVAPPDFYYGLMAPLAKGGLELWQTQYIMPLKGNHPVLEWIRGSILRPALDRLDAAERAEFLTALAELLDEAYPKRADGVTLFPFKRFFIVAKT